MTRTGPFSGVRVLDLSRLLPGAYATLILADLGADVVKVEEPERGDYMRWMEPYSDEYGALFSATCRNKRSVTLDLKDAQDQQTLRRLAEAADVVVESFRPGVADRIGAGYEDLREVNRRLVYCSLSGYGQTGPRAQRPGHDLNYQAVAGTLDLTGPPSGAPELPGMQLADVWGGGLTAALAVSMALFERERTGIGRYLDAAMFDGVTAGLVNHAPSWYVAGKRFDRGNMPLSGGHPNYRVYATADGYLAVGNYEEKFWVAFCEHLGLPHLSGHATATGAEAEAARAQIEGVLASHTRDEWMSQLRDVDTCVEPVLTLEEALESDDFAERDLVVDVSLGGGLERQLATPLTRYGDGPHKRAPRLGEHAAEVLSAGSGWFPDQEASS